MSKKRDEKKIEKPEIPSRLPPSPIRDIDRLIDAIDRNTAAIVAFGMVSAGKREVI